jgi:hypothetical protein
MATSLAAKDPNQPLTVGVLAASKPKPTSGGSRWQEINIAFEHSFSAQGQSVEGSSDSKRWNADFWIGSAGGTSEQLSGDFQTANASKNVKVEISMRVTMVTVDRSSWFQVSTIYCFRYAGRTILGLTTYSHNFLTTREATCGATSVQLSVSTRKMQVCQLHPRT